jgi:DNA-binding response OmpR family regulator
MNPTERKTVLIVDDDADCRRLLAIHLKLAGFDVLEAPNGLDAISVLNGKKASLIATEWQLPIIDGLRLLNWLQNEFETPPPVLVLTAAGAGAEKNMLESGADAVLFKPVAAAEILAAVEKILAAVEKLPKDANETK